MKAGYKGYNIAELNSEGTYTVKVLNKNFILKNQFFYYFSIKNFIIKASFLNLLTF
jgi:hypothetical protein